MFSWKPDICEDMNQKPLTPPSKIPKANRKGHLVC